MIFAKEVGESLTYKFAQAAADMRAHGREIISLGLGEPDFRTPQYVLNATAEAMNAGFTHYSATQGLPEFRELIAKDMNVRFGAEYKAADIVVTPGIKPAVFFALCALLEPGDEVVLFSPYYVSYPAMVKLAEPQARIVNVSLDRNFRLDPEKLRAAVNPKTKCILFNNPNNPTGKVFTKEETDLLVSLALENDTWIISDEVYEKLIYTGRTQTGLASYPEIRDRLIVTNGFSKSHAMTGWRLGFAIGAHEAIVKINKLQQHVNTNTCTFIQKGACSIYTHEPDHIAPYVKELERRIDFFHAELNALPYMKAVKPDAGFFCFADISATGKDSNSFCADLLQTTGIASTPGIAFGPEWDDYVRFSFAVPMETLERAAGLMRAYDPKA